MFEFEIIWMSYRSDKKKTVSVELHLFQFQMFQLFTCKHNTEPVALTDDIHTVNPSALFSRSTLSREQ